MTQRDVRLRTDGFSFQNPVPYQFRGRTNGAVFHDVVNENRGKLQMISREGIRADIVLVALILALAIFAAVLFSDLASISSGSRNIGQLQHTIGSLEDTNSRLRTQVSYYQNWSHEVAASNDDTVFRTVEISLPEN